MVVPAISVIVLAPDSYSTLARTLRALRAQTALERLELVVVAGDRAALGPEPAEVRAFPARTIVEVPRFRTTGEARASGVRAARAPVVALAEDHSFPEPGWAEALIAAHRHGWAGVAPAMRNANPSTSLSWAAMLADFGFWLDPAPAGEVFGMPGHNGSYKRAPLLEFGDRLPALLDVEGILHQALRSRGGRFYLEPRAVTRHVNVSRPRSWVEEYVTSGWSYGGHRALFGGWSAARRALYALGAPLIPAARLRRLGAVLRHASRQSLPRAGWFPALALCLALHSVGEARGYMLGVRDAAVRKSRLEFHRERHVVPEDLPALAAW